MQMDVSIIIVNYNSFKLLENCLSSLYSQTKDINITVIVIDNNSTDGNIEDIISRFKNIILIKNSSNKGFGAANNQGLKVAAGKYVLFLNNDTIILENTIKKVSEFAESINDPVIVGCKLLNRDKTLQHSVYDFPTLLNVFTSNFFLYLLFPRSRYFNKYHLMNRKISKITEVDVVTGAFLFASKEKIEELGGFDERFFFYNEETDLCYRFKNSGGKIFYFPDSSVIHLKGGTANKNFSIRYRSEFIATIKFYQKHFRGIKLILALIFHYFGMLIRIPVFFLAGMLTLNRVLILRSYYNIKHLFSYPENLFKKYLSK